MWWFIFPFVAFSIKKSRGPLYPWLPPSLPYLISTALVTLCFLDLSPLLLFGSLQCLAEPTYPMVPHRCLCPWNTWSTPIPDTLHCWLWATQTEFLHCIILASLKFSVSSLPIMRDTSTNPDDRISMRGSDNAANSITKCSDVWSTMWMLSNDVMVSSERCAYHPGASVSQ
jgi:hypothetical protein